MMCSNAVVLRMLLAVTSCVAIACALSVDDKTGCRTSADCLGVRICEDEQCMPGACEATCARACEGRDACGLDRAPDCEPICTMDQGILPGFSESDCKQQWDLLEPPECTADACLSYCRELCATAEGCALIADVRACVLGCQAQADPCSGSAPTACVEIPSDVRCYVEPC